MKGFVCNSCGSTEFHEEDGYLVCEYCGNRYVPDTDERVKKPSKIAIS